MSPMVTGVIDNVFDGDRCCRYGLWWWPMSLTMSLMMTGVVDNLWWWPMSPIVSMVGHESHDSWRP